MLQPKRTKFRKMHKGRIHGEAKGGSTLNFGSFGLKATQPERITARQIEAARRAMTRHMCQASVVLPISCKCLVCTRKLVTSGAVGSQDTRLLGS